MCRIFALKAVAPISAERPLWTDRHSLGTQSRGDAGGKAHSDGWGLAWIENAESLASPDSKSTGVAQIEKSTQAAASDPAFERLARSISAQTLIAHVRQASVGSVSLENTHPFVHGPWIFAHNGTLEGFEEGRAQLLIDTPSDLRARIGGETDSEHAFYYWLGKLRRRTGDLAPAPADDVALTLAEAVAKLARWFPNWKDHPTRINLVLSDGRLLAAVRWGHTLWRRAIFKPGETTNPQAIFIASEPTDDEPWMDLPDRSLTLVDEQLVIRTIPIG